MPNDKDKKKVFKSIVVRNKKREAADAKQTIEKDPAKSSFPAAKATNKASAGCPLQEDTVPSQACYLHHMQIREQWPGAPAAGEKKKKKQRDPNEIDRDIQQLQKKQEGLQYQFDKATLEGTVDYEKESVRLSEEILEIQKQILELELERMAAMTLQAPYKPPAGVREFTVVDYVPPQIKDKVELAEAKLKPLRGKLNTAYSGWYEVHLLHEAAKAGLQGFAKKKDELNAKRNKARTEYEVARRKKKAIEEKHDPGKKAGRIEKTFKRDTASQLAKAEEEEKKARQKFETAQSQYSQFTSYEYGRLNTERRQQLQKLVAKQKEIEAITKQIEQIETEAQEARNTLPSGATIQMIAFWKGTDEWSGESGDTKTPTVTINIDKQTRNFREGKGDYCKDAPSKRNGPGRHPYLVVEEDVSGSSVKAEQGKPAELKIYEAHRSLLGPSNKLTAFLEIFRHIFSAFPKKRNYTVKASACGFMPSGYQVPSGLEANIEVFPADSYKLILKTQPGFGVDAQREERIADTTKIASEEGQTAAENAASARDHIVSSSFSMSALGVTQYSVSESRVAGADGRVVTTTSELKREGGPFGAATMTDDARGTLIKDEKDATATPYESHLERTSEVDWWVEDPQGKVTKMDEQWGGVAEPIRTSGARVPALGSKFMPQIPVDLVLSRNGIEDPVTEELRRSLGLIVYFVKRTGEIASRIGNIMPSVGWKFGFSATFLTGSLAYTHEYKEHIDYRVWLHRKFDTDLNLVSLRIFVFGGVAIEGIFWLVQAGIEGFVKGSIGVKGSFENTHPDADKSLEIGFGPTGSIGAGIETKAIVGQPDWFMASGTIETALSAEGTWWATKADSDPYFEGSFKWEGIVLKGVIHLVLVGHWEASHKLIDEREIASFRFPKETEIEKILEEQNRAMDISKRQAEKEAAALEKKLAKHKK